MEYLLITHPPSRDNVDKVSNINSSILVLNFRWSWFPLSLRFFSVLNKTNMPWWSRPAVSNKFLVAVHANVRSELFIIFIQPLAIWVCDRPRQALTTNPQYYVNTSIPATLNRHLRTTRSYFPRNKSISLRQSIAKYIRFTFCCALCRLSCGACVSCAYIIIYWQHSRHQWRLKFTYRCKCTIQLGLAASYNINIYAWDKFDDCRAQHCAALPQPHTVRTATHRSQTIFNVMAIK